MSGRAIVELLDDIVGACNSIKDAGACMQCPLYGCCIEEESVEQFACDVSGSSLDEFFGLSKDCDEYIDEDDMIAHFADQARKMERDEHYD